MGPAVLVWLVIIASFSFTASIGHKLLTKESAELQFQKQLSLMERLMKYYDVNNEKNIEIMAEDVKSKNTEDIHNRAICQPGYTGTDCESVCDSATNVYSHDGMEGYGDVIDFVWAQDCAYALTLPIDVYVKDLYIGITSMSDVFPKFVLLKYNGQEISETTIVQSSPRYYYAHFANIVGEYGEGNYMVMLSTEQASDGSVCLYYASATTELVIDGGFVTNRSDDFVQEIIPGPHQGVGRLPKMGIPSHFAFKFPSSIVFPGHPTEVILYTAGKPEQRSEVQSRYKCSAAAIAGPFTCSAVGELYFVKIKGIDENGYDFQRTYDFDCEAVEPPTTTKPPIPSECYNGGILVNQMTECYCGPFYEGYQCEVKRCFNSGVLGDNDQCVCQIGYSGNNCQDVVCPAKSGASFDLSTRALTFIIRSGTSMTAHMPTILEAARNITAYYSLYHPFYFQKYLLVVFSNGEITTYEQYDSSQQFINGISSITHRQDLICDDILLTALAAVLSSPVLAVYRQSPIFIFSDGLSNDGWQIQYNLLAQLTLWRGQIFFMLTDSVTGRCNIDMAAPGYRILRNFAQFSHGLVSHVSLDQLGTTAFEIAQKLYRGNYLLTNDLLDSCKRAPKFQNFFVDPNIQSFYVIATGTGLSLTLTKPDRTKFTPDLHYVASENTYIWAVSENLQRGSYLLQMGSTGVHPCQYRVIGRGDYDLFLGVTSSINDDAVLQQPAYNVDSHIVAHINNVVLPDPQSLHAEALIWTNEGEADKRTVLYASSGVYRDNCDFYLYFGAWKCLQQYQLFYVNVFITNNDGFTIQRTTSGFCSQGELEPTPSGECQNGGVSYNGTCICPANWLGDKCQNIQCKNLGTPMVSWCACIPGFTGQYCETVSCYQRNTNSFSSDGRSLTFIIHDGISTRTAIRSIRDNAARLIQDISHHQQWITEYQLYRFTDAHYIRLIGTGDPNFFLNSINTLYNNNAINSEVSCRNLTLLAPILDALNDPRVTLQGMFYVFINGYIIVDTDRLSSIYEALEKSHVQINIVMLSGTPCGRSLNDYQNVLLMNLASFSGGEFILVQPSNAGLVVRSIPTHYRSSYIYENFVTDCSTPQSFYIPVDSQLQSFTAYFVGDLANPPVYRTPNGFQVPPHVIWDDKGQGSRLDQIIRPCDDGWQPHDNRCWKYGIFRKTWRAARDDCHESNSALANIFTAEEQYFLDVQTAGIDYWLGLNDIANIGVYMWDQPGNETLSLEETGYTNWASGEPNNADPEKRCVYDKHGTSAGWTVYDCNLELPYICMKHAYDVDFDPDSATVDILSRGMWKVTVQTTEGACSIQAFGQSGIQLFNEYITNIHSDFGSSEPYVQADDNRIISHVTNQQVIGQNIEGHLQYAHMYTMNLSIIQAQHYQRRSDIDCAYEYMSTSFKCPGYTYQQLFTGIDRFGYLYQRIEPVTCLSGPTDQDDCRNGAVFYQGKCVCPPRFQGDYCEVPMCVNGILGATGVSCRCYYNYLGDTCEIPICLRHGNISDPTPLNKTFVLLFDGIQDGDMVEIQNGIKEILTKIFATTNLNEGWFTRYMSVIFRDSEAGNDSVSDVIESSNSGDFINAIEAELASKQYHSSKKSRSVVASIVRALEGGNVSPRSFIFIVTAGNAEDYSRETVAFNEIAKIHAYVFVLIVNDKVPPGGLSDYTDPSLDTYFNLAFASGGGYYQLSNVATMFAYNFNDIVSLLFRSYHVSALFNSNFSSAVTEYVQVGANTTVLILDILSDSSPNVTLLDADGNRVDSSIPTLQTETNRIFAGVAVGEPGLWTVSVAPTVSVPGGGFVYIAVKGVSNMRINIAFTHDLGQDNGIHSDTAEYFPIIGDDANAVVADTDSAVLTFVQAFSSDERRLLWASPLIARQRCTYTYVSATLFTCQEASVAIAVEGEDLIGHPVRRMFHVHCVGSFIPPTPDNVTTTTRGPTTPGPTTAPLPTCNPDYSGEYKSDVAIVFDTSLGFTEQEYIEIMTAMLELPEGLMVGQQNNRFMLGVYWDQTEFILTPDFTTVQNRQNYSDILSLLIKFGYQGEMGNNIYSALDYLNQTTFRKDALRIIVIFSSMGWDKSNSGEGFPDPTAIAAELRSTAVRIVPVGFGPFANQNQLEQISPGCVRMAQNMQELRSIVPWLLTLACSTSSFC